VSSFLHALKVQRWDDHRYYHHSRINQSLHLLSATSFLVAYAFLFINPPVAALIAWLISMVSRQSGHFFFEPKGYDEVNQATHEFKEEIKVGYNLQRKVVLMAVWAGLPVVLWLQPDFFGLLEPHHQLSGYVLNVGWLWLWLGVGGLVFPRAAAGADPDPGHRHRLGHQDHHRPLPRHPALLEVALVPAQG
jgi:hypothetical protein